MYAAVLLSYNHKKIENNMQPILKTRVNFSHVKYCYRKKKHYCEMHPFSWQSQDYKNKMR